MYVFDNDVQHIWVAPADVKYLTSYSMPILMFALPSVYLSKLLLGMFDLEHLGQGQGVQFSQWRHSMANVKIYKRYFFLFLNFAKVRPVRTKVSDTQTDAQTDTQTDIQTDTDRYTDGHTDRHTDRHTDSQHKHTHRQTHRQTYRLTQQRTSP